MIWAKLPQFEKRVRIVGRKTLSLTLPERLLLQFIIARAGTIIERSKIRMDREWESFEADQGADPFGPHCRVEIGIDQGNPLLGIWSMQIYWSPDDADWSGAHIGFDYFLDWPRGCEFVF